MMTLLIRENKLTEGFARFYIAEGVLRLNLFLNIITSTCLFVMIDLKCWVI